MTSRTEYKNTWAKKDRQRRIAEGICIYCSAKATGGYQTCDKCRKRGAKHGSRYQRKKTLAGYGITQEQYLDMYMEQDGKCLICGQEKGAGGVDKSARGGRDVLVVDHNHTTGEVRGLLCSRCNLIIGNVEAAGDLLPTMFKYLEDKNESTL